MIAASLDTTFMLCLCTRLKDTVLLLLSSLFRECPKKTVQEVNKLQPWRRQVKGDHRLKFFTLTNKTVSNVKWDTGCILALC